MRLATLMVLALAALPGTAGPALAAPPERPAPAAAPAAAPPPPAGARAPEKRRRTSYAACNRESHRRDLHGGPRRRFLIRCRLGYERRSGPTAGPAAGPARRP